MRASRRSGVGFLCVLLVGGVMPALADTTAGPWGTRHGNYYSTASADDPSMVFSNDWAGGATQAWSLDTVAAGLNRTGFTASMVFDEDGNVYWIAFDRLASVDRAGNVRWIGKDGANAVLVFGVPGFDKTNPVIGDGGASGRVYVVGQIGGVSHAIAFSKATGVEVWRANIAGANFASANDLSPVLYNGKLYVIGHSAAPNGDAHVYQINSATGAVEMDATVTGVGNGNYQAGGSFTLVPDAFGAGKHGLYFNMTSGSGTDALAEMFAIQVDTNTLTANLAWSSTGGHVDRSHVSYVADQQRVCTATWTDYGAEFYCWNLDGTFPTQTNNGVNSGHGFYDVVAVDFNGKDVLAGGFDGRVIRYRDIAGSGGPVSTLYDSAGFETLALGDLPGQGGWLEDTSVPSGEPDYGKVQVVADPTASGKGNVIASDAPGTAGGWLGAHLPFASPSTKRYVILSFDIYRTDNNDNLWLADHPDFGQWWAILWDTNGSAHAQQFNAGVPVPTGAWAKVTYTFDFTANTVKVDVNGTAATHTSIGGSDLRGFAFEDEPGAFNGAGGPTYLDNLKVIETDQIPGVGSDGYYQFASWFGEPRVVGGLYKNAAGDSILVAGTNSRTDLDPSFTGRVIAGNMTTSPLNSGLCSEIEDGPAYIDDIMITGGPDPGTQNVTHLDVAGFESYAAGTLAGQAGNPGGTGTVTWADHSGAPNTGPVQVIADPTGGGKGKVIKLDAQASCNGFMGVSGALAAAATDNVVNVKWKQYRVDTTDNLWVADHPDRGRWAAIEWDTSGITPQGFTTFQCGTTTTIPAHPLTPGVWQDIRYEIDLEFGIVSVYVDGVCRGENDLPALLPDPNAAVRGIDMYLQGTTVTTAIPSTPIMEYDTTINNNHGAIQRGGPLMGPTPCGEVQQIYYFNTVTRALVAIKPTTGGVRSCAANRSITAWKSIRSHSGIGELAITLKAAATGNGLSGPSNETRGTVALGVGVQKIRAEFDGTVTLADASKITVVGRTTVGGVMGAPVNYIPSSVAVVGGNAIELTFASGALPDASCYTITVGVGALAEGVTGDADVMVRSLWADVNANGQSNIGDALAVKASLNTAATARPDLDLNMTGGNVNIGDAILAKSRAISPVPSVLCP